MNNTREHNNITLQIKDDIAKLNFDLVDQKVNKLSIEVLEELDEKLDSIKSNLSIRALIIQSKKENIFIAGADIKEIEGLHNEKKVYELLMKVHKIFNKLENLPYPSIAYINGACMGGGLELALACTYRVATTSAKTKLAFPEIKLGFFPGFAGTIRAPKTIGLINSLDLILTGKTIDAKKAYRIALVDEIFDHGQKKAKLKEFVKKAINKDVKKRKKFNVLEHFPFNELVYSKTLKGNQAKVSEEFKAPYSALDVIQRTYKHKDLDYALQVEAREFSKLAVTKESKNLIKLFFSFEKNK